MALIDGSRETGYTVTVQGLEPIGPVLLAIFGGGERGFRLESSGRDILDVELTASRWLEGGRRVCFFSSLPSGSPVL